MKVFWALVKNNSKLETRDRRERSLLNGIYFGIALALGSYGLTWASNQGFINVGFTMWCFLISIPFVDSIYLLNKEWQEGTIGWWLTLPYSRSLLLSAKCVTSFWHVLKMYAILFAVTQIMSLVLYSTLPDFLPHPQLLDVLQGSFKDLTWLFIMSPFSILLGALVVILTKSFWAPESRLSLAGLGLLANLYVAKSLGLSPLITPSAVHPAQGYFLSVTGSDFFTALFVSIALSTLLFAISVYVLKRHVEV